MKTQAHIFPVFTEILQRTDRERFLQQHSKVVWLTGLSGSGKTTIAKHLERKLFEQGFFAQILDGDNIRSGINSNLGFSLEDRQENIRRIAEIAKLYLNSGVIVLASFISPTAEIRDLARSIIGAEDFIEIFVNTPLQICEQRDTKGLYTKARRGLIQDFSGVNSPYESPAAPALEIKTDQMSIEQAVDCIYTHLEAHITITNRE
ncbi:MAG TPA: adenylyl-sulfate kinase [Saprospiraceae bacterium]|nr:adenylyl-sulfate kinase [Saprospiraceae bacterium]HMP23648.1 adenylyl-sulfate kinase [Saprospiraceae bacterium]